MSVARPARAEQVGAKEVENGLVLRHASRVHNLNATASVIFELCDGTRTADEIVKLVQSAWDLERSPLEAVLDCLAQLRVERLII
jgi:coenzyme PQQ synthesis protein D (PqqD)